MENETVNVIIFFACFGVVAFIFTIWMIGFCMGASSEEKKHQTAKQEGEK